METVEEAGGMKMVEVLMPTSGSFWIVSARENVLDEMRKRVAL